MIEKIKIVNNSVLLLLTKIFFFECNYMNWWSSVQNFVQYKILYSIKFDKMLCKNILIVLKNNILINIKIILY